MTSDDIKNTEILEGFFEKNFALKPESVEFAKKWLRDPQLDPMFKNIIGDDFRVRWDVPITKMGEKEDVAWSQFKHFFPVTIFNFISYNNFINNNIVVNKNTVKLSKFIASWCTSNKNDFILHIKNMESYFKSDCEEIKFTSNDANEFIFADDKKFGELLNKYILSVNEVVGRKKAPKDLAGYQLVLSFNFADWLLVSTATSYTSCISLESHHGFWYGLPFILDDRNRALMYLVKKTAPKKEYLGIKVDDFSNREWLFLSNNEKLVGFRWYPKETPMYLSNNTLQEISGLPIRFNDSVEYSKYPIGENIHLKNTISFFATPYLDTIGLLEKAGKYYYTTNGGCSGTNTRGALGHRKKFDFMFSSKSLAIMVKAGLDREEIVKYSICPSCGKIIDSEIPLKKVFNNESGGYTYMCNDCFTKDYTHCHICGSAVSNKKIIKTKLYKNGICPLCFEQHYTKCEVCGAHVLKEDSTNNICLSCIKTDKTVFCYVTKEPVAKKKAINFLFFGERIYFSNDSIFSYFLANEKLKEGKDYDRCSLCGEIKSPEEIDYMFDGAALCRKCSTAIADRKQFKFDFFIKKPKREARAG